MFCFTASIWRSLTLLHKASLRTGSSQSFDLTLNSNNFTPPCHHSDLITIHLPKSQSSFTQCHMHATTWQHSKSTELLLFRVGFLLQSQPVHFKLKLRAWASTSKSRCCGPHYLSVAYDRVSARKTSYHTTQTQSNHIILTSSNMLYLYSLNIRLFSCFQAASPKAYTAGSH